jgi:hypothetical protein
MMVNSVGEVQFDPRADETKEADEKIEKWKGWLL